MAHFAKLDENNVVLEIVFLNNTEVIDPNTGLESEAVGIEFLTNWSGGYTNWKQTSYNNNFRKNYAGIGSTYDPARDAFIGRKVFNSWLLNETTCQWEPPIPYPSSDPAEGRKYRWDEESTSWVLVE